MKMKLLVHVNDPERWLIAISSITNFLNDVGDKDAEVVVVANGAGVKGYMKNGGTKAEVQGEACLIGTGADMGALEILAERGVTFFACTNAIKAHNLDPKNISDFVKIVPAGMTEMVKLQAEGFAYIKP